MCLGFCLSQTGFDSFSPPCLFCSRPRIWISGSLALLFPPPPRSGPSCSLLSLSSPSGHTAVSLSLLMSVCFVFSLRSLSRFLTCQSLSLLCLSSLLFTGLAHFCLFAYTCCSLGCMCARVKV